MRYIGNGHYCYANVTAMLLDAVGERVKPETIEVLSGVGVGAHSHTSLRADLFALVRSKEEQAALIGRSHTLLVRQGWPAAADAFERLAIVEDQFRAHVAAAAATPS